MDTKEPIKILIVDDVEDNRLVLKGICRKLHGAELLEARDGEEAVKVALAERPDIVLMDLLMSGIDGFAATERIKSELSETFVLAVTAINHHGLEEDLERAGFDGYILKPVSKSHLMHSLRTILWHIELKRGHRPVIGGHYPINPFSRQIRAFKTVFYVEARTSSKEESNTTREALVATQ
ncbi:MAG: response regulator [Campylobacterales bacterium]